MTHCWSRESLSAYPFASSDGTRCGVWRTGRDTLVGPLHIGASCPHWAIVYARGAQYPPCLPIRCMLDLLAILGHALVVSSCRTVRLARWCHASIPPLDGRCPPLRCDRIRPARVCVRVTALPLPALEAPHRPSGRER